MDILVRGAADLGFHLTPQQVEQFRLYLRELLEWNRRVNLTAIVEPEEVQRLHFLDSLSLLQVMPPSARGGRLLDVGTGAGFPGLPLKVALPSLSLAMIEATGKKVRFLEHIVGVLGLDGVEIHRGRAEELAHIAGLREAFDVVTARALAPLSEMAELALPFCRRGGIVALPKKGQIEDEVSVAARALDVLGGRLVEIRKVGLEGLQDGRLILVVEKVGGTPASYPRRPGIPHKRPL